jgi:hypothetical protein
MKLGVKVTGTANPFSKSSEICHPLTAFFVRSGLNFQDDTSKAKFLVSFNHDPIEYRDFRHGGGRLENAVLIRLEPAAVFPSQFLPKIENLYGKIFTPGSVFIDQESSRHWPYYFNLNPLTPNKVHSDLKSIVKSISEEGTFDFNLWKSRSLILSLVASNKVSPIRENNYRLRRRLARTLPSSVLTIYGGLWKGSFLERVKHRVGVLRFAIKSGITPNLVEIYGGLLRNFDTAMGEVSNKHTIIRESKFSLVIENDNSYVSEKLIDALIGGSIPIYIGGDFSLTGIPKGAVVTGLTNAAEILGFIENVSDSDASDFLFCAQHWLQSPAFYLEWFGDSVYEAIAKQIFDYFGSMVD